MFLMKQKNTFTALFKKVRGGYTAWVLEMPGVISEGKTRREAKANLADALKLMIETNSIMGLRDASGDVERAPLSIAYDGA